MLQLPPAPPINAVPAAPQVVIHRNGGISVIGEQQSPTAIYRARVAQRSELAGQRRELQEARDGLSEGLQEQPMLAGGANRTGIESRIARIDAQIEALDKQIAAADVEVAQAAGVPGAVVEAPRYERPGPPEEAYVVGSLFIVVVFLPLSIAYARRIWRRGAVVVASLPGEVMDRLTRLDQAVDSVAVEVERIGEGQRFMTRVMAERSAATPEPLDVLAPGRGRT